MLLADFLSFLDNLVPSFMMEGWFLYVLGPAILIGLVVVLLYMRNKRSEDDDD